jgi:hypothetical protein
MSIIHNGQREVAQYSRGSSAVFDNRRLAVSRSLETTFTQHGGSVQ